MQVQFVVSMRPVPPRDRVVKIGAMRCVIDTSASGVIGAIFQLLLVDWHFVWSVDAELSDHAVSHVRISWAIIGASPFSDDLGTSNAEFS